MEEYNKGFSYVKRADKNTMPAKILSKMIQLKYK